MKISIEEVKHIADLSKLDLCKEELELFTNQLDQIINFVSKLNEVDTSNIEKTSHVLNLKTPFREDEVIERFKQEDALKNAPDSERGYFKVPKIID